MTIPVGLSATKTGFDLLKFLRDALKKPDVDLPEVQARLLELQELMLQAQKALGDAEDDRRGLVQRIEELERLWKFGLDFVSQDGVYWLDKYPYCPNCWEADRKPTRLSGAFFSGNSFRDKWTCPIHNATFYLPKRH